MAQRTRPVLLAAVLVAASLRGQCTARWQPGLGVPGVDGPCNAVVAWDPDGPGPRPELIVVGGAFAYAGNGRANNIAAFDVATETWSPFGVGVGAEVFALAVMPTGELVAGGNFTTAGGIAAAHVAMWNGTAWAPLGAGRGPVTALCVLPNGHLVAGGNDVAEWDGSTWTTFTTPIANPVVKDIAVLPNGEPVVVGRAGNAGFLMQRNGTGWSSLTTSSSSSPVSEISAVVVLPSGETVVGGRFDRVGFASVINLARYTGNGVWSPLGGAPGHPVTALEVEANGELLVAGWFHGIGGVSANSVAAWNGTNWRAFGAGLDFELRAITGTASGDVVAVGDMPGGARRWDGTSWRLLGAGFDDAVAGMTIAANGDLHVVGAFEQAGSVAASQVARWDGAAWSPLGGGLRGQVSDILPYCNGTLVAVGYFTVPGHPVSTNTTAAIWHGTAWKPYPSAGRATTVALVPAGGFVVGGDQPRVSHWNGQQWIQLGSGLAGVNRLLVLPNGEIYAGGSFNTYAGQFLWKVAHWTGSSWQPLGAGIGHGDVYDLAFDHNGNLLAAVWGGLYPGVRLWNGSSWSAIALTSGPSGQPNGVRALLVLPNGDVLAGGTFDRIANVPANGLARWDGQHWTAVDAGVGVRIDKLLLLPDGDVLATIGISEIAGGATAFLARIRPGCPPVADPVATACIGPAGPVALTAEAPPWIGTTFRSTASGFASGSLALALAGVASPNLPLSFVHPSGLPNCLQLASSEVARFAVPALGHARFAFELPNIAAIAGFEAWHQFVQIEFDPQGGLTSLSSSGALHLRIGAF